MATIKFEGMDRLIAEFMKQEAGAKQKVEKMLTESAPIVADEQKKSIERHRLIDTGSMMSSVRPTKIKQDRNNAVIYVYPQGKDKKRTRNAAKAFIKEYGTSKTPGTRWMESANAASMEKISEIQAEIWGGTDDSG